MPQIYIYASLSHSDKPYSADDAVYTFSECKIPIDVIPKKIDGKLIPSLEKCYEYNLTGKILLSEAEYDIYVSISFENSAISAEFINKNFKDHMDKVLYSGESTGTVVVGLKCSELIKMAKQGFEAEVSLR